MTDLIKEKQIGAEHFLWKGAPSKKYCIAKAFLNPCIVFVIFDAAGSAFLAWSVADFIRVFFRDYYFLVIYACVGIFYYISLSYCRYEITDRAIYFNPTVAEEWLKKMMASELDRERLPMWKYVCIEKKTRISNLISGTTDIKFLNYDLGARDCWSFNIFHGISNEEVEQIKNIMAQAHEENMEGNKYAHDYLISRWENRMDSVMPQNFSEYEELMKRNKVTEDD